VLVSPQKVQLIVIPVVIDLAYNVLQADRPAVQVQGVPEVQIKVIEEDIDLPLIFPFINWYFCSNNILPF
jgi:hypothetical protein